MDHREDATPRPMLNRAPGLGRIYDVHTTLDNRELSYGSFVENSALAEAILDLCKGSLTHTTWQQLAADQKYAITMNAYKLSRILTGNPNHSDSWHGIAGYATLVDKRLKLEGN